MDGFYAPAYVVLMYEGLFVADGDPIPALSALTLAWGGARRDDRIGGAPLLLATRAIDFPEVQLASNMPSKRTEDR